MNTVKFSQALRAGKAASIHVQALQGVVDESIVHAGGMVRKKVAQSADNKGHVGRVERLAQGAHHFS